MSQEHPIDREIKSITITDFAEGSEVFVVGHKGVTRIEACTKSGMYADIAYVRVWRGDTAIAEFCQHNIVGVYFAAPIPAAGTDPMEGK